mgnify:CR=1 FL=1
MLATDAVSRLRVTPHARASFSSMPRETKPCTDGMTMLQGGDSTLDQDHEGAPARTRAIRHFAA